MHYWGKVSLRIPTHSIHNVLIRICVRLTSLKHAKQAHAA
jgi:hypothetical protein